MRMSSKRASSPFRRKNAYRRRLKRSLALGLTLAAGPLVAPMRAHATEAPIVQTREGRVQGFVKDGVAQFLGIPYAAPPVGKLRWMPPVRHAPWSEVLQSTAYGSNCPQTITLGVFAGPVN